jgi:Trk-type K+ transport system membrane component
MSYQRAQADDGLTRHYTWLGVAAAALVALGTVVFRWLEDDWSWVDSFYFSVVAVTTVGFGDFSPTTDASKLFAVFYILIGISLIATALNGRLRRSERRVQARIEDRQSRGEESER